jgi:hypothetical protein
MRVCAFVKLWALLCFDCGHNVAEANLETGLASALDARRKNDVYVAGNDLDPTKSGKVVLEPGSRQREESFFLAGGTTCNAALLLPQLSTP